ncbi:hypothetical protein FOMPIDRAFT_92564 [Fomitopsis schrenkii]|uniref:Uncharacterized protein n=1 Tax=Fomitopsis schrenkii TaxID=2126942 RepID=S8FEY1_FOMSC|nr:hypothetical protein FOMPIDRAFT_92564 [Fomitopsis schrenkii]
MESVLLSFDLTELPQACTCAGEFLAQITVDPAGADGALAVGKGMAPSSGIGLHGLGNGHNSGEGANEYI